MLASRRFANNPPAIPRCSSPQRSDSTELAAAASSVHASARSSAAGGGAHPSRRKPGTILAGAAGVAVAEFALCSTHPAQVSVSLGLDLEDQTMRSWNRSFVTAFVCAAAVAVAARPVFAATTTLTHPTVLSGSRKLSSVGLIGSSAGVTISTDLLTQLDWGQLASIAITFDPNRVRQGRPLDPQVSYGRNVPGGMAVVWTLSNVSVSWDGVGPIDLGSPSFSASGSCNLMADGGSYTCHLSSVQIPILDTFPLPGPYVKLALVSDVTISPSAIGVSRQALFDDIPDGTASLALLESPITDTFSIPCTAPAGSGLTFSLGTLSTGAGITVSTSLQFDVGAEIAVPNPFNPPLFLSEVDISFATPEIPIETNTSSIAMNGAGMSFDLGQVEKNNIPPTANAGGPYAGNEGNPITLDGSGSSSICGFPTLVWSLSDGGAAFGKNPQHTFPGSGSYSGELTAIDATGLTALATFGVSIVNLPPVVHAGPDTSSAWGVPVAFNGSAVDPGTDDQPTLSYSWTFGDGSPSASGGASTTHAYAAPGNYTATLISCDEHAACAADSRVVHVVKRNTTAAYTGDSYGVFDTPAMLAASVVDELGSAVPGRTVVFKVGSDGPFTASTNASGTAVQGYTPALGAGTYTASASFAGDALYNPSTASDGFAVFRKATSVVYTGATFSKPNKVVALSAVLKDATGNPLAGRTIALAVGAQNASATTDALGVAATTLQMNQKNGTYTLTATFAPAGGDVPFLVGSSDTGVFALQAK